MNEHNNQESAHSQSSKTVEQELETCKQVQQELHDKWMRLNADFENYKRRMTKDQQMWMQTAQQKVLVDLLPIVDDFDRAFEEAQKTQQSDTMAQWFAGFSLIRTALQKLLKSYDVYEMAVEGEFNPELHEAIMHVDAPDKQSGVIVAVVQKGYMYKDAVLRPARVSVAR